MHFTHPHINRHCHRKVETFCSHCVLHKGVISDNSRLIETQLFPLTFLQPVPGGLLVWAAHRSVSAWRSTHWDAVHRTGPAAASLDIMARSARKVLQEGTFPLSVYSFVLSACLLPPPTCFIVLLLMVNSYSTNYFVSDFSYCRLCECLISQSLQGHQRECSATVLVFSNLETKLYYNSK